MFMIKLDFLWDLIESFLPEQNNDNQFLQIHFIGSEEEEYIQDVQYSNK